MGNFPVKYNSRRKTAFRQKKILLFWRKEYIFGRNNIDEHTRKGYPLSPDSNKYDSKTRERLQQVSKEEWEKTLAQVLFYARRKTALLSLLDYRIDSEELVQEAIGRAYGVGTGKFDKLTYRNWDQDKYPLLANFLKSIVKSLVDHILKEHIGLEFLPTVDDDDLQTQKVEGLIHQQRPSENPETSLLNAERAKELLTALDAISSDDEEIGMYLLAVQEGHSDAVDQAKETGYDVKQIYNIRKRLRRKLAPFIDRSYN